MAICVISLSIPLTASAETALNMGNDKAIVNTYVEHYADGSYAEIEIAETITYNRFSVQSSTYTKNGYKTYKWMASNGTIYLTFTVHGTFQINSGVSSTCIANSHDASVNDGNCSVASSSSYRTGNQAIGNATFKRKFLFVTVDTKNVELILSCDVNGNLS